MLAIKNNIMAANAARHMGMSYDSLAKSVERLASGQRINSAKDDAAGLAVRELFRSDIAVLQQGSRNAQDGISMLQTMEGAMAVIDENLIRMKELAEQAATGSYSSAQRTIMNSEFAEMADEIERIAGVTEFNGIKMLNTSTGDVKIHVGGATTIDINKVDMTQRGLDIEVGAGEWTIMTTDDSNYTDIDSQTVLNVTGTNYGLDITFQGEEVIDAVWTTGTYTLEEVRDAINLASKNPSTVYDANGNLLAYEAAEIVETNAGEYKLRVSARDTSATTLTIGVATSMTAGEVVKGIFGSYTTGANIITYTGASSLFEKWDTSSESWVDDTAGHEGPAVNILTVDAAVTALATVTAAINTKVQARADFGYKMNRLESTIAVLDIQTENMMTAESRISDVDVATEMATLTRTQVLAQAGISMLAQANAMPQMALTLLR